MKIKRISVIILILTLTLNCGKDEPLEPASDKKSREKSEKFKPACIGAIALWYGSCNNRGNDVISSK